MTTPYAINYTDKFRSARFTTFFDSMALRKFLVANVVAANTGSMSILELLQAYNAQNGDLIEVNR
jgi:hypothetical protein